MRLEGIVPIIPTPFDLEGGKLRESGIYLKETGETGYIQEVDVRV